MRAHGLRPKKALGQNFLCDRRVAERIAAAAAPEGGTVLEIGAGLGALTRALLDRAERVVAIERDRELCAVLEEVLGHEARLRLVPGDALALDWAALFADEPRPHAIAGNLPYAITGRLVAQIVGHARSIARAVVMVQREVGERLTAAPGGRDYGLLTVFVQAAFAVERVCRVPAAVFLPPPQVESVVIALVPHATPRAVETADFARVVKSAFATRRKTLRNAWRALELPEGELAAAASRAGVSLDRRAEELAVEDFARMARELAARASS
ncbi:MAG: ribosomal RNA small subunit methyltransferase A [Myxococcales bacterium]|nr:ribosomal RNA small subunit methyltransferase A [Myxococcales bacterium]